MQSQPKGLLQVRDELAGWLIGTPWSFLHELGVPAEGRYSSDRGGIGAQGHHILLGLRFPHGEA
ncbi:hypothetical protein GCM10011415_09910 [Salipiger pallidus]|uniref:Uncharacterized protein n=1 Tax=Salipiger pallidus TaxID=1775170 RepID=A0A8J3EFM3_9RHOB|nr:hypothetical protein GCM10011415_09910 [Salipiger pallidus]